MTSVIEQPQTVDLIKIPAPKFSIGQTVEIGEHGETGKILGWMYAPVDPHPTPEDSQFPVWEEGFSYFIHSVCFCASLNRTYDCWDTLPESVLKPIRNEADQI